jgi:hypothetical protein
MTLGKARNRRRTSLIYQPYAGVIGGASRARPHNASNSCSASLCSEWIGGPTPNIRTASNNGSVQRAHAYQSRAYWAYPSWPDAGTASPRIGRRDRAAGAVGLKHGRGRADADVAELYPPARPRASTRASAVTTTIRSRDWPVLKGYVLGMFTTRPPFLMHARVHARGHVSVTCHVTRSRCGSHR